MNVPGKRSCSRVARKFGGRAPEGEDLPELAGHRFPDSAGRTWKYGARIKLLWKQSPDKRVGMYGGSLDNDAAVFPIKMGVPQDAAPAEKCEDSVGDGKPYYGASTHPMLLSDDGRTIGGFAEFSVMNVMHVVRVGCGAPVNAFAWDVDVFAAGMVQEYGYRFYGKKQFADAAGKFADAAATAPRWELPRYNEACAWALGHEPEKSEASLVDAIARATAMGNSGGDVKKRAKADKDFAAYKTADWFLKATQ
jgi:hypothetical protein